MSKPKACRYERSLGYRAVKGEHADDCTDPAAHRGCVQCLEPHCGVCGREHLDNANPATCPDCVGSVREDLGEIGDLCRGLRRQAVEAEGLAWASARIPGATAMVLMGPSVDPDEVIAWRDYGKTHRPGDPVPPLTVLARWEETWAGWLGQVRDGRATITRALGYLDQHLTRIAQTRPEWRDGNPVIPPEFREFARDVGRLRAQLEHVLHDESEDESGIPCFECGHQLVRRIRDPRRCRHKTPARMALAERLRERQDPAAWLELLRGYGVPAWPEEIDAARLPSPIEVAAARLPCDRCDQGGVADPRPGISWECPSCRMRYSPGEYATAVRRDLVDRGDDTGWCTLPIAADAARDITGRPVTAVTIRTWIERGDEIAVCCAWTAGQRATSQLVFWPDVLQRAAEVRSRGRRRVLQVS